MSLTTLVYITDPCNEQLVFLKCREIIGIPAEHVFEVRPEDCYANGERIHSEPGGFASALDVTHDHGEPITRLPGEVGLNGPEPTACVIVRLDTTYGYADKGPGCDAVHDEIIGRLGEWLNEHDWWAQNEYTQEWFHRSIPYQKAEATQ